jgi:ribosomal RNA methyltransferase Nop2
MDGFFVAKFHKMGPTPANAVLANGNGDKSGSKRSGSSMNTSDHEEVDKTPISADEGRDTTEDEFGGFDDDEDSKYMLRAKKNAMRRRGLDPRALNQPAAKGVKGQDAKDDKPEAD